MKTVTIHFHDGHKQDVECPEGTEWIEITRRSGSIWAHKTRPRKDELNLVYRSRSRQLVGNVVDDRRPCEEGHTFSQLLKVEEV